jgi:hypothetical protein
MVIRPAPLVALVALLGPLSFAESEVGFLRQPAFESLCQDFTHYLQNPCACWEDHLSSPTRALSSYAGHHVRVVGYRDFLECEIFVVAAIEDVPPACPAEPEGLLLRDARQTWLEWGEVPCSTRFDVIRGDVSELRQIDSIVDLGPVTCLLEDHPGTSTNRTPDATVPPAGTAFFYVVRPALGFYEARVYGVSSEDSERQPFSGDCAR